MVKKAKPVKAPIVKAKTPEEKKEVKKIVKNLIKGKVNHLENISKITDPNKIAEASIKAVKKMAVDSTNDRKTQKKIVKASIKSAKKKAKESDRAEPMEVAKAAIKSAKKAVEKYAGPKEVKKNIDKPK